MTEPATPNTETLVLWARYHAIATRPETKRAEVKNAPASASRQWIFTSASHLKTAPNSAVVTTIDIAWSSTCQRDGSQTPTTSESTISAVRVTVDANRNSAHTTTI